MLSLGLIIYGSEDVLFPFAMQRWKTLTRLCEGLTLDQEV